MSNKYAMSKIGAPYACGGVGRGNINRYECSTLLTRAYSEGAGLKAPSSLPNTTAMTQPLVQWLAPVSKDAIRPGDLVFYRQAGTDGSGSNGHAVMALGSGFMIDTGACGNGVRVQRVELDPEWIKYDGAFRVNPLKAGRI